MSMDAGAIARGLIYIGGALVGLGLLVLILNRIIDLGHLPGDFAYEGKNVRVYVPVGTMIVVSIVLTVLLNLVLRLFR